MSSVSADTCPQCSGSEIERIEVRHAQFRHFDFTTLAPAGRLSRCESCQFIANSIDASAARELEDHFQSRAYAQCETMSHTLFVREYARPVKRTFVQARLFQDLIRKSSPVVLDIGCFDGDLLREIDQCFDAPQLHGYDVNEHLRETFPTAPNFRFWSSSLDDIDGRFDLISISGSIVYIDDIPQLMNTIDRLLAPDGLIFVQSVDIAQSPYAILLGDQRSHFSARILQRLFSHHGFVFETLDNSWAPKEIVGLARRADDSPSGSFDQDPHVHRCVSYLDDTTTRLRRAEATSVAGVGVLGTSAAAAFVDSVLQDHITFFVDENPERVDRDFRSKPVRHPASLSPDQTVLLPYGEQNERIKARFDCEYSGRFECA